MNEGYAAFTAPAYWRIESDIRRKQAIDLKIERYFWDEPNAMLDKLIKDRWYYNQLLRISHDDETNSSYVRNACKGAINYRRRVFTRLFGTDRPEEVPTNPLQ